MHWQRREWMGRVLVTQRIDGCCSAGKSDGSELNRSELIAVEESGLAGALSWNVSSCEATARNGMEWNRIDMPRHSKGKAVNR